MFSFNAWSNYYLYAFVTSLRGTGMCLLEYKDAITKMKKKKKKKRKDFAPLTVFTIIEQFLTYE